MSVGLEDYLREGDARMRWAGRGAAAAGLEGVADLGSLEALLEGVDPEVLSGKKEASPPDPADSEAVKRLAADAWSEADIVVSKRRRVKGYELSMAPPKSVSVLWAGAMPWDAAALEAILDEAVDAALAVLDGECSWSRKGKRPNNGWIRGEGLFMQVTRHSTSRAGDPQLHDHVVVANEILCADGGYRSLDSDMLFDWRSTASTEYARVLYAGLERLGVELTVPDPRTGIREVATVPEWLCARFSTRTAVIDDIAGEIEERTGETVGAKARALISDQTRQRKDLSETLEEKRRRWKAEAGAEGARLEAARILAGRGLTGDELEASALAAAAVEAWRDAAALDVDSSVGAGLEAAATARAQDSAAVEIGLGRDWGGAVERLTDRSRRAVDAARRQARAAAAAGEDVVAAAAEAVLASYLGDGCDADRRRRILDAILDIDDPAAGYWGEMWRLREPAEEARWDEAAQRAVGRAALVDLTDRATHWDRCELVRTLMRLAPAGVRFDDIDRLAARMLAPEAPGTVAITTPGVGVDDPARQIVQRPGMQRWATAATLSRERTVDAWWREGEQSRGRALDATTVAAYCQALDLNAEQTHAVAEIATGKRRSWLVVGAAGSGKTTMIEALTDAARHCDVPIVGVAVSQDAATTLTEKARLVTHTIDSALGFHGDKEVGIKDRAFPAGGILVVDEASMTSSRQLYTLLGTARERRMTVVAVGDDGQFGPVKPGELWQMWVRDPDRPRLELTEILRPHAAWEADVQRRMHDGDLTAVDDLHTRGRLLTAADDAAAIEHIAREYVRLRGAGDSVAAVAGSNAEVDRLNAAIRDLLFPPEGDDREAVVVAWSDQHGRRREFPIAVGDEIVTLRNDATIRTADRRKLTNGDRWRVTGLDRGSGRLKLEGLSLDARIELPAAWLNRRNETTGRPLVQHGWALNAYKVQGGTVDCSITWVSRTLDKRGLYVGMTRARHANWAIAVDDDDGGCWAAVRDAMRRDFGTSSALEADRAGRAQLTQHAQQPTDDDRDGNVGDGEEPPRRRPTGPPLDF